MKINPKILSIPPYISTAWKNVVSLHLEKHGDDIILIIGLVNGSTIEVPNLTPSILDTTFAAHQKYLEQEANAAQPPSNAGIALHGIIEDASTLLNLPIQFGIEAGGMGNILQHNQEGTNAPDLPPEVLERIAHVSKMIGFGTGDQLPKPEPHCNCTHCQVMRTIHKEVEDSLPEAEEEVKDEELAFREWDIEKVEDELYMVSNPFDKKEQYRVFLGSPVGCTCGKKNCEHIQSVLRS